MFHWWEDIQPEGPQKMLNFLTQVPPLTFDPIKSFDLITRNVVSNLYEGLLVAESHTAELQPGIVKSWEVIEHGSTYLFYLRPNTRFSDGEPILPRDIIFSFKRIAESQEIDMEVTQVESRAMRIRLGQPIYNFLRLLATPLFSVVSKYGVEKYGFQREDVISSGPFRLKKQAVNSHPSLVVLEKNPYYWDAEHVKLDGVVYIPIMDADERLRIFRTRHTASGERMYYFLNHGPVLRYEELKQDPELQPTPVPATILLTANGRKKPLDNANVRRALSLAIDRQTLANTFLPFLHVADALIPPGIDTCPEQRGLIREDVAQAQTLLQEAGFPGGAGFPTLTLTIHDHDYLALLAQHLIQNWKRVLGIDVRCIRLPWGDYLQHVDDDHYDLLYETWHTDIEDPCSFLLPFVTEHPSNRAYYSNTRFDEIMEQSFQESDDRKRAQQYLEAEKILMADMPMIPLFYDSHFCMIDTGVVNARLNKSALLPLKYVELNG